MADLAALGAADAAGLAGGEGRHVVVQHEVVAVASGERLDGLLVTAGAERGDHQGLRLAAREQGGTVGAGQHAGADGDGPHGAGVAPVDARLAAEDAATHHLGFQAVEQVLDDVGGGGIHVLRDHLREHPVADLVDGGDAGLLLLDGVGLVEAFAADRLHLFDQRGGGLGRGPLPGVLAGHVGQLVDGVDGSLHLFVAEHHGAQHDVLGQFLGLGLDHQHGGLGTGHHQVQLGALQLGLGGIEHVLAVHVADAGGAQGTVEGQAGQGQGGGSAEHGGNVGIHLCIGGHHGGDDLHFIEEAVREKRTDGPVDQAGGQGFLLGGLALALEEATRDASRGVGLLHVVDGQREEVLTRLDFVLRHHGDQHHGVVHADDHRAGGLTGDLAGFQGDFVATVLKCLFDRIHAVAFQMVVPIKRNGALGGRRLHDAWLTCAGRGAG